MEGDGREEPLQLPMVPVDIKHLGAVGTGSRQSKQQISAGTTCFDTLPPRFMGNGIEGPLMTITSENFQWGNGCGFPTGADAQQNG